MVEANFRLVVSVARQTVKTGRSELNFQDACQEGILGLMKAVDKYDPELGFRFSTYAIWWIKKMIHANVAQQAHAVRLPANVLRKINDIRMQERVLRLELHHKPTDDEVAAKVGISVEQLYLYRNSANDIISLDKSKSSSIIARVATIMPAPMLHPYTRSWKTPIHLLLKWPNMPLCKKT